MKIAVQTGGPEERLGTDTTYRIIKEAGFDGVDVNLDHLYSGGDIRARKRSAVFDAGEKEMLAACRPWKDAAEKYGLENYQAHAPFPSLLPPAGSDPDFNDYILTCLEKTIRCSAYIGAKRLVIHPFFLGLPDPLTREEERELNVRSYSRLIDAARKNDVIICLENMFSVFRGKIYGACCSDVADACYYVDTLNAIAGEKRFGFCLDTGHILLAGKDVYDVMVQLGSRIEAFHVHDNNGVSDQHLAPYMGILDWNRFVKGLAATGFDKTMSFETFNVWNTVDNELCPDLMKFIAKAGRTFAKRAGV